ncbi:hypothetical protein CANINC_003799 [Pichia inconspicua]|uniref:RNA helicase n=1 Tax=Pichia inconspicua TaxID=52247 RepID=A0A4T0WZE3_9ASCO|nr:hypothetical protein CANINC_003799 [[Candida] inconspicua]
MAKKTSKTPPSSKSDDEEKSSRKGGKSAKGSKGQVEELKTPAKNGRAIVAQTSSWTGKLPASLLHEHCQKQKWGKVEYDMKKLPEGFLAIPQLQWENPKTKENIQIKYHPPKHIVKPQETPLEARHFGATYALHRIAFNKNIHMVLPSNHKSLWSDLETERKRILKEDPQRAKLEYANDPFSALLEKRKEDDLKQKRREAEQAAAQKVKKPTITIGSSFSKEDPSKKPKNFVPKNTPTQSQIPSATKNFSNLPSFPRKIWEKSIMFDIDPELRVSIESAIKNHVEWSEEDSHFHENVKNDASYISLLENLGFKKSHILEATNYTYTFNDSLEWLVFHLPDDDLPFCFTKQDSDSNVVLKITKDLKQERLITNLMSSGFSRSDTITALEKSNFDLISASVYLTNLLNDIELNTDQFDIKNDFADWFDEKESLRAILDNRVKEDDPPKEGIYKIALNPEGIEKGIISLNVYKSKHYPYDLCGLLLKVNNKSYTIPNYIKTWIIAKLIEYLHDIGAFGMPYIYSCVDWLEQNILNIINNPGPLYNPSISIKKVELAAKTARKVKNNVLKGRSIDPAKVERNYLQKSNSNRLLKAIEQRKKLPAWQKKDEILSVICKNRVCLITGETGSGKSTQIVQFVIDYLNAKKDFTTTIICTQPRRISTIGLAERISDERADVCGKEVGYIIRGENKTSDETRISFVTTGVMLRMIQSVFGKSSHESDSFFQNLGYVFIDEVHERSIDSDFLLIILKNILKRYPKLKVVLMSATIDKQIFDGYFDPSSIAHAHIEGRTFPIEDCYLTDVLEKTDFKINSQKYSYYDDVDDELSSMTRPSVDSKFFQQGNINYDLISELVYKIDDDLTAKNDPGSILIFLPGVMETKKCLNNIEDEGFWKLPLHSALSSQEQKRIFDNPPNGKRKVIASTNIAETSITIPDAVVVIDTGRVKSVHYDAKSNHTKLVEIWASKAETKQRRGRAGRIRNGICYKLFTKNTETKMIEQPVPEIKRTKLESVYLVVKAIGVKDVHQFLKLGLDPPHKDNVDNAKKILTDIGALDFHNDELTSLGKYLSMLPTDLKSGKMMIFGCIFGCVESCLTLAAIGVTGSPFSCKEEFRGEMKKKQQELGNENGDMIAILNAFNEFKALPTMREKRNFCTSSFLSWVRMNDIDSTRSQYLNNLKEIGFVPFNYNTKDYKNDKLNRNNNNIYMIKSIITAASYPQIARVELPDTKYAQSSSGAIALDPEFKKIKYWCRNEKYSRLLARGEMDTSKEDIYPSTRIFMHPSSSLFINEEKTTMNPTFIVYNDSQETSKLYAYNITPTSTISILLFGGQITYDLSTSITHLKSKGIVMDNWLPIRTWCKNGVLIGKLRILLDQIIKIKLDNPQTDEGDDVLKVIEQLVKIK